MYLSIGLLHSEVHSVRHVAFASDREARLVLTALDRSVEQYFSSGLASSTRRVYMAAYNHYLKFCNLYALCTAPASEHLLCRFVTYLTMDKVSGNSVKVYLSVVRQLHLQQGLPPPNFSNMPRLQQVIWGIKITQAITPNTTNPKRSRLPIIPQLLQDIHRS